MHTYIQGSHQVTFCHFFFDWSLFSLNSHFLSLFFSKNAYFVTFLVTLKISNNMLTYLLKLPFCCASVRLTNQFIGLFLPICLLRHTSALKVSLLTSKIFALNCRLHAISECLGLKKGRKWLYYVKSYVIGCLLFLLFQ